MAEGNSVIIQPLDLIYQFRVAIDEEWGYIYGKSHIMWTEKLQNAYAAEYNSDPVKWKDHELSAKLGSKWIGHWVTDCSGLFAWAFKALGSSISHGSNSIWKKHCSAQGELSLGARTDGQELKPGTAVFTGTLNDHGHIGLYIGGGEVIEAAGTKEGVIISKITKSKWTFWGELKNVQYEGGVEPVDILPEPGTAIVTATKVALRSGPNTKSTVLTRVDKGQTVKLADKPEDWDYVEYNGQKGYMMSKYLQKG